MKPATFWTITDGKAGDRNQALAIAHSIAGQHQIIEEKVIKPSGMFSYAAPWGPCDPRVSPFNPQSPLAEPWPDIVIATGRRMVPVARTFLKAKTKRPFIIFLKSPRVKSIIADFIWTPSHDTRHNDTKIYANYPGMHTLTGPIRMTPEKMRELVTNTPQWLKGLPTPRLSIVIGGNAGKTQYTEADAKRLSSILIANQNACSSYIITTSRRTPAMLQTYLQQTITKLGKPFLMYNGDGENPYPVMLAAAENVIVTGDSHNMVSEALASEASIYIFRPSHLQEKIAWFLDCVEAKGYAKPLEDEMQEMKRTPFAANTTIAEAILKDYAHFLQMKETAQ